jgi:hypothetical protein
VFNVNGFDCLSLFSDYRLELAGGSLFSGIAITPPQQASGLIRRIPFEHIVTRVLAAEIGKWMRPLVHGKTLDKTRERLAFVLLGMPSMADEDLLRLEQRAVNQTFSALVGKIRLNRDNPVYKRLFELYAVARFAALYDACTTQLTSVFNNVQYVGPVRTRNERYYRYQELSVSEIDPDGRNFPMFLNSLSDSQVDKFSRWVSELFGYGVRVDRKEGHISINVRYDQRDVNVVDTG